jgi:ABC-type nitrate/sulfonate/bicarbonate transport system permease component
LIQQTSGHQRTDELFAAVLMSAGLGMVIFGTVSAVGRLVTAWWSGER